MENPKIIIERVIWKKGHVWNRIFSPDTQVFEDVEYRSYFRITCSDLTATFYGSNTTYKNDW